MADKRVYSCVMLTGGASGALDALPYNSLQDGELAFTVTDDYIYVHVFDASSSSSESSPDVIAPDDVGSNTGRWLLRLSFLEPLYIDRTNSRLGLGKSPSYQLDMTGSINLENTTHANQYGIIYKEGTAFFHNFNYGDNGTVTTVGHNLFIGEGAGNFTMGSIATQTYHGSYNVGIGDDVLHANTTGYGNVGIGFEVFKDNTSGHENTGVGHRALRDNTVGRFNSAFGSGALLHNTNGEYNSAFGARALHYNTDGDYNSALGASALLNITSGTHNIAIGYSAGAYIANGTDPNETSSQCIFIGSNTKASADGVTNEIVIGYNMTGKGSNTIVLGNDSITKTFLKGSVSIGVADPDEAIHVSGKGYFTEGVRVREDVDDYGGNFTNYTPPTGASALIILAADTNATNPGQRLYAYVNGSWRYVDLT